MPALGLGQFVPNRQKGNFRVRGFFLGTNLYDREFQVGTCSSQSVADAVVVRATRDNGRSAVEITELINEEFTNSTKERQQKRKQEHETFLLEEDRQCNGKFVLFLHVHVTM